MTMTELPPSPPPAPVPPTTAALPMTAKYHLPPIHPEGRKFIAIAAIVTLVFGFVLHWQAAGWLMAGITAWVAAFFRDPERTTPVGEGLIISPADGMVCMIADVPPPRQLDGADGLAPGLYRRVSVFMNVFDVHINRAAVAGIVRRIAYVPGKFLNADLDKASDDNERQYFVIETGSGERVGLTQIAGLVARRILRFVHEGDHVAAGERIGLIRFGSRVDVYLPHGYAVQVLPGQRCVAGETVLARRGAAEVVLGNTQ